MTHDENSGTEMAVVEAAEVSESPENYHMEADPPMELDLHGQMLMIQEEAVIARIHAIVSGPGHSILDPLPDAPVTANLSMPRGYFIQVEPSPYFPKGINRLVESDGVFRLTHIAANPVLVAGFVFDMELGEFSLLVLWKWRGEWKSTVLPRQMAFSTALMREANNGLPLSRQKLPDVNEYLHRFEITNEDLLPIINVSSRLGMHGEHGEHGFVLGGTTIAANGEVLDVSRQEKRGLQFWDREEAIFRCNDPGTAQIAGAFKTRGSYDQWLEAVNLATQYPKVMFGLVAAASTPFLGILDVPNHTVDFAGESSAGKTTTLKVAGSVWGNPTERDSDSVVSSWDGTSVYFGAAIGAVQDVPLILDDTKKAGSNTAVSKMIYRVHSGRGRARGAWHGAKAVRTSRTVLLSSGEAPITSFSNKDGGARGRVLQLWGSPFGEANKETGEVVRKINRLVERNYGFLGPKVVAHVMKNRDNWTEWREQYEAILDDYVEQAEDNPLAQRIAAFFALHHFVALQLREVIELDWDHEENIATLWPEIVGSLEEKNDPVDALRDIAHWAQGHETAFWGRHRTDNKGKPLFGNKGCLGRWDTDRLNGRQQAWPHLGIYPHVLKRELSHLGYEAEAVLRSWRDRDWLAIDGDRRRLEKNVRVQGVPARLICIQRSALEEIGMREEAVQPETALQLLVP